ncbi:hypothetical protein [Bacillus cereus group sp. TH160LC]|uniref:hypothetical protein n=1 Tax=Bacillus cereus group sp. TH160LC TaxID=3018058 RepID=UPI0022E6447E|nr:hypothetical protein [Bacillus cereus group sp. TH160LC]MDA1650987.1 hypothetical protein [Bacillus cereus group sp. TH160LC]
MNTQAAIEAAKIAAETAARNAWITTIVTVIALFITSGISVWSVMRNSKITKDLGEKNLKALEQRRYIDAICTERVKWINSLQEKFSDFLKNVNLLMIDVYRLKSGNLEVDKDKMSERLGEVMYLGNHIFLLLNPTEPICKEIRVLQVQICKCLENFKGSDSDKKKLDDLVDKLSFFYQVVLKVEWKRVKEENKKGEEIDRETMKKIYKETSKNIDIEVYDNLYTNAES